MPGAAIYGPTYAELSDPSSLPEAVREAARIARHEGAVDPLNLYNLHWMDDLGEVTALVLPSELTGVSTPVAVLLGEKFPAGVVHGGAAYAMLVEHQVHQEIRPGAGRVIVPSGGAFGLGAAWVARAMGYPPVAVVPKSAIDVRRGPLEALGAEVQAGGLGPADALGIVDAAWAIRGDDDAVLNPYADFAAYRFHARVTGAAVNALAEALAGAGFGSGRVSAFVAPTGPGALLAAGEATDGLVLAAEPAGCAPLAEGSWEHHDVPDAGPRVPGWTDHVMALDGAVSVAATDLEAVTSLLAQPAETLAAVLDMPEAAAQRLSGACGPAAGLAVAAALKAVRYYGLRGRDLVVVAAPEGQSPSEPRDPEQALRWLDRARSVRPDGVVEASTSLRRRWHAQKYGPWVERRGKGEDALRRQADSAFWAEQRHWADVIDQRILAFRGPA